jgi:hypothetical protein
MWLDESDTVWSRKDRNIYTAHEIAQIIPLVNKNKSYEKFLLTNKWVLKFWPNAVKLNTKILRYKDAGEKTLISSIKYLMSSPLEKLVYQLQYLYMKPKITREVVTPTRGIFHPQDWGKIVLERLRISGS